MVGVVNTIASVQNAALKSGVQSMPAPEPAPPPPISSIDFVTSGIHVDNLQNVAILEYRSSQTGKVIRQYPDQVQIAAFKAAERLARLAEDAHRAQAQQQQQSSSASTVAGYVPTHSSSAAGASAVPHTGGAGIGGNVSVSIAGRSSPSTATTGASSTMSVMA